MRQRPFIYNRHTDSGIRIFVAYLPQSKARFLRSGGHSLRWPRLDFFKSFRCIALFISGEIPFYIDAFFEMVSGFTTTGASIVPVVEDLSRGILYWRSFSHWLGGMGVLVFLLAIVPSNSKSGGSRLHLLKAESPGPDVGKLVPKMRDTAMILYVLYIALTLLNILFLLAGKCLF